MAYLPQIFFLLTLGTASWIIAKRAHRIRGNIRLGKENKIMGRGIERLKQMVWVAFGQKKMFKKPLPAFLHLLVYVGFLLINVEVLEFILDGLLGTHRFFLPYFPAFYNVLLQGFEFLSVSVMAACLIFLVRRNGLKVKRFWLPEMTAWPRLDGNIILLTEIVLMLAILTMNASDRILQVRGMADYRDTGPLPFSAAIIPLVNALESTSLIFIERFCWWFHIVGILGFAVYITYSKHLHILLAFPNTYFAKLGPQGHLNNMPVVTREVKAMLGLDTTPPSGEPSRFGAKDIADLTWDTLLSAYTCTECGRCSQVCPANMTGKKLSPRKIMMDVRDRMEEVGRQREKGITEPDGKFLLGDYITKEEVNACTSCQACVEACPVLINPLDVILELRRYIAMEESGSPTSWNLMFQNMETNFAPWKFPASDRFQWAKN